MQSIRYSRIPQYQHAANLASIDVNVLHKARVLGIILDLDNTIISEDDRFITPNAIIWINQAKSIGIDLFILSNGKRKARVVWWSKYLGIPALSPARKPLPYAFSYALKQLRLSSRQVVVIGDSWHTDVLGARWTGCPVIQVASLPHPARWWEAIVGRWIQIPCADRSTLCHFPNLERDQVYPYPPINEIPR